MSLHELSKTHDYVFALNLENQENEVFKVDKGKLILFNTVERTLQYMEENKIAAEDIAIVIDNGHFTVDKESAAKLDKLNFSKIVVSLQANRGANVSLIDNEKVKETVSQKWGVKIEDPINVIPLERKQ